MGIRGACLAPLEGGARGRFARDFRVRGEDDPAFGILEDAARRWGNARKALTLFRQAGETASERDPEAVTRECLEGGLETTDREATMEKLFQLPLNHSLVLTGITGWDNPRQEKIIQPIEIAKIHNALSGEDIPGALHLGERAIRDIVTDLETMGVVETWIDSRGNKGRTD